MSVVRLVNTSQDLMHIFAMTASPANFSIGQHKPHVQLASVANLMDSTRKLRLPHVSIVQ